MFGSIERQEGNEPYFTSEEYNMLLSINPKFKDRYETQRDQDNRMDYNELIKDSDEYDRKMPADGYDTARNLGLNDIKGSGCEGGFPFIPLIGSLLGSILGKGKDAQEFAAENQQELKRAETELLNKSPKSAWNDIINIDKSIFKTAYKNKHSSRKGFSKMLANEYINGKYPKKFINLVSRSIDKPSKRGTLTKADLALPIVRYGCGKISKNEEFNRCLYKLAKQEILKGRGLYTTGGFSFGSIFKFAKKILGKVIPKLVPVAKKVIKNVATPENIQYIADKAINKFDKFGVVDKLNKTGLIDSKKIGNIGADLIDRAADRGADYVTRKAQGSGGYYSSDDEIEQRRTLYRKKPAPGMHYATYQGKGVNAPNGHGLHAPNYKGRGKKKTFNVQIKI